MAVYLGNTEIGQIFLGSTEIAEAYLGSTKVWESTPPTPLPYDAQVEWLQGDGNQYIDVGLKGGMDVDYEITVQAITNNANQHVLGDMETTSTNRYSLTLDTRSSATVGGQFYCGASNSLTFPIAYNVFNFHTYKKNGLDVYVDGNKINTFTSQTFTTPNNLMLFCARRGGEHATVAIPRIKSCKFWKNGELVRDFIAVRVGSTGYMYDKVSGTLFGNVGTGSFAVGADIIDGYVQEGLIFHLDGIEKGGTTGHWIDRIGGVDFTLDAGVVEETNRLEMMYQGAPNNAFARNTTYGNDQLTIPKYTIECVFREDTTWANAFNPFYPISGITFIYSLTYTRLVCGMRSGSSGQWTTYTIPSSNRKTYNTISMNTTRALQNGVSLSSNSQLYQSKQTSCRVGMMNGAMYAVRIYNRVLTAAEMLQNQTIDNTRFNLGLTLPDSI